MYVSIALEGQSQPRHNSVKAGTHDVKSRTRGVVLLSIIRYK